MNRIYISALMAMALTLSLGSCTSDESPSQAGKASSGVIRFSLTGDHRAKTRTETQSAREKAVTSVLAVAFYRSTGKFATCAEAADISSSGLDADWRANLGTPDLYDVYFVANASAELKTAIEALTSGTSTKDDFFAIEATQDPGTSTTDGAFLMTSEKVEVDVDSNPDGTLLGSSVTVTRASARIDLVIDDDVMASVSKVTLKNRYTSTKMARIGADVSMTGLDASDEDYTVSLSGDGKQLSGTIYAYEDPTQSTVLVIEGRLADGTPGTLVTPMVRFDAAHANVALQRNHLYTVRLSLNNDTPDVGDVAASIVVKDWNTGDVISRSHTDLAVRTAPTYSIEASGTGWTYDAGTVTLASAAETSFAVTVNNTGSTCSKVVCKDQVEGFTVAEGARTVSAAGLPVQTFTVTILENTTDAARSFTFAVENLLDADATGTATFTVSQPAGPAAP